MSRFTVVAALATMFMFGYVAGFNRGYDRGGRDGINAAITEVERQAAARPL